jgi:DNA repair exonuclease SbcCD nuclease subunit
MRMIAAADVHLGFGAYERLAPTGENQRSADVAETFTRFIDRAIELRPDLITLAGDVFHRASPRNRTIVHGFREVARLTRALPDTIIVMVAGNHDYSHSDGSCALPLFAELPNVHVAWSTAMRFRFPERDLSVLAVPDVPMQGRPSLRPAGSERFQVLVLHGEATGVEQVRPGIRATLKAITPDEMGAGEWSAVALGHYHQLESLGPNTAYSGSLDFASSDPWKEIGTPKGFLERDLSTGAETFHVLEPGRRFLDLDPLYGQELTPEQLDRAIADALNAQPIDGSVVRQKILGVSRDVARALNHKALREFKRRALVLYLDIRPPAAVQAVSASGVPLGRRRFSPIEERVREFCGSDRHEIAADVDRGELTAKMLEYVALAAAKEVDAPRQEAQLTEQLTASISAQDAA